MVAEYLRHYWDWDPWACALANDSIAIDSVGIF